MDPKEIRELIDFISRSNFASFELEGEGFKLKLIEENSAARVSAAPEAAPLAPLKPEAAAPPGPPVAEITPGAASESALVDLRSPIVGTFYRSPGPDAASFVEIGTRIKKGQVVCIVEAMKVMNEIEAEIEAEIVEILIANGQPVEFGEVMFRLRPLG